MTGSKTPIAVAGAVLLLLFLIGLAAQWHPLVFVLLTMVALGLGMFAIYQGYEERNGQERQHALMAEEHRAAQARRAMEEAEAMRIARENAAQLAAAPVRSSRELTGVALPSALPEFTLEFACTVHWRAAPDVPHADPGALAVEEVLLRARTFAAGVAPEDEVAGHSLAVALGAAVRDKRGLVDLWATGVVLRAPLEERTRLLRARAAHQEHHVWKRQVEVEREVRDYFEHDVLSSSGDALLWWLANNRDAVRGAVDMVDPLTRLSSVARGEQEAPVVVEPAGFVVDAAGETRIVDLLPEPGEPGGTLFGASSSDLLDALEQPERAERMRERYGLLDVPEAREAPAEDALSRAGLNGHGPSTSGTSPNGSGPEGPSPDATARD
ncbi:MULTISPECIES: hypothetical protein [Actinosynnema]|uniref:hypothetical protein n=1 Tax=Actinosynnema TaxID=40566 RepID=UPI0026468875|nr:hypothetical protein [Actinosynnema pretiosum]MCP2096431.1 hypothetical protein [Actinosynnema pretiosum]